MSGGPLPFELTVSESGLHFVFGADAAGLPSWRVLGSEPCLVGPVEIGIAGAGIRDHHGSKHTGHLPGRDLRHREIFLRRDEVGQLVEWHLQANGLEVTAHWRLYCGVRAVRTWVEVQNSGQEPIQLEYISSLAIGGLTFEIPWEKSDSTVHLAHNTWYGEAQWKSSSPEQLGLAKVNKFSMKRIHLGQSGTWPTSENLPMGLWELPDGRTWGWQLEHQGSWHWEISDLDDQLYLQISGPAFQEHGWVQSLRPGERFQTVPAALVLSLQGPQGAIQDLTRYRRRIRRAHQDLVSLPVIFNDYMNCLMGDPTTEALRPLIDAAAEAGCEVFCIDAGWYADGEWFDGVGEWLPSAKRFPNGILEPLERIRQKGMVPGLWLEIEVMGVRCPLAHKVPDDWFFQRNGKRVSDNGRHFLDFRNAEVRAHADRIVERLVEEYGVGYIKMDYNNNAGAGTDWLATSAAEGLLGHQRAYLQWLDDIFDRYPFLVIENCGSGGLRMEYALLSRHQLQSVSDQTDFRLMAPIAAASPTAVTPEQAAIWSYPMRGARDEVVVFNMINAMLLRIHQSGHLSELSDSGKKWVQEGISAYKTWRHRIPSSVPFWPLGWPSFAAHLVALGLEDSTGYLLAVWNLSEAAMDVRIPHAKLPAGSQVPGLVFPAGSGADSRLTWSDEGLTLSLPAGPVARLMKGERKLPPQEHLAGHQSARGVE